MIPTNRTAASPGEVLRKEFLGPSWAHAGRTQAWLARQTGYSNAMISRICDGSRRVGRLVALRLGRALGTSPELWTNLQANHDASRGRRA